MCCLILTIIHWVINLFLHFTGEKEVMPWKCIWLFQSHLAAKQQHQGSESAVSECNDLCFLIATSMSCCWQRLVWSCRQNQWGSLCCMPAPGPSTEVSLSSPYSKIGTDVRFKKKLWLPKCSDCPPPPVLFLYAFLYYALFTGML